MARQKNYNPERRAWRGRAYRAPGRRIGLGREREQRTTNQEQPALQADATTSVHEMTVETKTDLHGELMRWACTCGRAAGMWLRPTHWREERAQRCHWFHLDRIDRETAQPADITAQMSKLADAFA